MHLIIQIEIIPKKRVPLLPIKTLAYLSSFIPKNPLTINRVKALSNRTIYKTQKIESELQYKDVISVENAIANFVLKTSHPSPLGYTKSGMDFISFKGSNPFSKTNRYLLENKRTTIDWSK